MGCCVPDCEVCSAKLWSFGFYTRVPEKKVKNTGEHAGMAGSPNGEPFAQASIT